MTGRPAVQAGQAGRRPDGRFAPGVSGNPKGRVPGRVDFALLVAEHRGGTLQETLLAVFDCLAAAAAKGDTSAAKLLLDRVCVTERQFLELGGYLENAPQADQLSQEEIDRRVASLVGRAQARLLLAAVNGKPTAPPAAPGAVPEPSPDEIPAEAIARAQARRRRAQTGARDVVAVAFGRDDVAVAVRSGWHFEIEIATQSSQVVDLVCGVALQTPIAIAVDTPGAHTLVRALAERRVAVAQVTALPLMPSLRRLLTGGAEVTLPPGHLNQTALLAIATTLTDAQLPSPLPSPFERRDGQRREHDPYA